MLFCTCETPSGFVSLENTATQGALADSRPWAEVLNCFAVIQQPHGHRGASDHRSAFVPGRNADATGRPIIPTPVQGMTPQILAKEDLKPRIRTG